MTEKILPESIRQQVQELFQKLDQQVQILFFDSQNGCEYCEDTRQLIEEVAELSDKLSLSQHNLEQEPELARQHRVDKAPALVIAGRQDEKIIDHGLRFSGIPAGHEFSSLIETLMMVSRGDSGLEAKTRQFLSGLTQPVHLQVFVTPT